MLISFQYEEVNADQLQKLLNDQILKGLENRYKVLYLYSLGQTVIYSWFIFFFFHLWF